MLGFKFIKFQPNIYVLKYKKGKIKKEGAGLSFYYYAPTTSLVGVPTESIDAPFIFEEVSSDFQFITVQGQVTYRISDPKTTAKMLNYSIDPKTGNYLSDDPEKLSQRIINVVQVLTKKQLSGRVLHEVLKSSEMIAGSINDGLSQNPEIKALGVEVLGVSILAIKPNQETSRALEAETRERILKNADDAIYERRNASVEQERKIKENELNTEIAVEEKRKQIRETQMDAEKAVQEKQHELKSSEIAFQIEQEKKRSELINNEVENKKKTADAKAYEMKAVLKSFEEVHPDVVYALANMGMQPEKLIALAFQELAENADKIGHLNISPDLLGQLLNSNNKPMSKMKK